MTRKELLERAKREIQEEKDKEIVNQMKNTLYAMEKGGAYVKRDEGLLAMLLKERGE